MSGRLVELLRDFGPIQPVVVRKIGSADYEILGNVETWMAAQQARLDLVPIHIIDDLTEEEAAEILRATFAGFASDPIDEAEYFQDQLEQIEEGGSRYRAVAKLAYLTGNSRTHISHSIRLLKLPIVIQQMVRSGQLTVGHAEPLVGVALQSSKLAIAKRIVNQRLSVQETRTLVREVRNGSATALKTEASKPATAQSPDVLRLQKRIAESIGCEVRLDTDTTRLTISYHNLDILDGVLAKLGIRES